jgi:hypothetical protein
MNRIKNIAYSVIGGGILLLVSLPPTPAKAAPAPPCVSLSVRKVSATGPDKIIATATNRCSGAQRFRIIWRWAPDTACYYILRGGSLTSERRGIPQPYPTEVQRC